MQSDKGFAAYFISHSGKTHRRYDISGWKLHLLRAGLALVLLMILASAAIVAFGLLAGGEMGRLREEVAGLQDSLAALRYTDSRLSAIEDQLECIRADRALIENMAGLIPPERDTLP